MAQNMSTSTVLVCEDDMAMVRIFQFLLRQQGVGRVTTTSSGEAVAAMALQHKPDLILLDMMLPGKDGLAVLSELKMNPATREIPVIIVSGKESQLQVKEAMAAGAIDYVVKPFDPMELGVRIKNFLDAIRNPLPQTPAQNPPPSTGIGGMRA